MKITMTEYKTRREDIYNQRWITMTYQESEDALNTLWREYIEGLEVGDKASVHFYTDDEPCTVIKRTAKTITIRYDKARLDPEWKPEFIPGGFCAHCTNNHTQQWIIEDDPNGTTETFRLTKQCWTHDGLKVTPGWYKHYDYNF